MSVSELLTHLNICKWSQFTWSPLGQLLLMISFILEGPVNLIIIVLTNIKAVASYTRFLKRKAQVMNQTANNINRKTAATQTKTTKKEEEMNKKLLVMTFII